MAAQHHRWVGTKIVGATLLISLLLIACSDTNPVAVQSQPQSDVVNATTVPPSPDVSLARPEPTPTGLPAPTATPVLMPTVEPTATSVPAVLTGAAVLVRNNFDLLQDMRVGLIAHQPSRVNGERLADLMHASPDLELVALFAPEHGIDGSTAAGASVNDTIDAATGAPIFSLYGLDRSPTDGTLAGVDLLVYDLQDVGSRFFTYISTLGLSMQAASQAGIPFVVLDRPNPLGHQLQGPALVAGTESFIGLYPLPSAYGLTSGELALLIKRQGWLDGLNELDLRIVELQNWRRDQVWDETQLEWIAPSPNLPSADAALIYPGTVLFEATSISEGRGTDEPFLTIAAPWIDGSALARNMNGRQLPGVAFEPVAATPRSIPRAAPNPQYLDQQIEGVHITVIDQAEVAGLEIGVHLLDAVMRQGAERGLSPEQIIDRPGVFDLLAGSPHVRTDLTSGRPVEEILASFDDDHRAFELLSADIRLYD